MGSLISVRNFPDNEFAKRCYCFDGLYYFAGIGGEVQSSLCQVFLRMNQDIPLISIDTVKIFVQLAAPLCCRVSQPVQQDLRRLASDTFTIPLTRVSNFTNSHSKVHNFSVHVHA